MKFSYFIFLCFIIIVKADEDYCKLRCKLKPHIACNTTNEWSTKCPADRKLFHLDDFLQVYVLQLYNEKRNMLAGGGISGYGKACRMATMKWDKELAYLAVLNAMQCAFIEDKCHNTKKFKNSGQNLMLQNKNSLNNERDFIKSAINLWFRQHQSGNQEYIDKFPSNYGGRTFFQFAQIAGENNVRVGCALSTFNNKYLFVCNYATTNVIGQPVYRTCNTAGENCTTGMNPFYTNLCFSDEEYNLNE